ncbi:MAG TPA: alpha-hydroxy acid oxidase [Burkholderiales bacterium]|nr:alpha-hydroxy acid oxidase [Burkholderiales bacterium]
MTLKPRPSILRENALPSFDRSGHRRRFLQWLAASPLLPYAQLAGSAPDIPSRLPELEAAAELIARPGDAINVFDFEPVFRRNVPPAHAGYMYSGIDGEVTLRANREAFSRYYLRPRRLVDVSEVDTSVEIFGVKYRSPIFICPTGGNRAYHPDGELAVARAAKAGGHLEMLATPASASIEDAMAARGAPVWFQLYASPKWEVAEAMVKRAEGAGAPVVVVTVDRSVSRNQETFFRMKARDPRDCKACHPADIPGSVARKPAYDGIDLAGVPNLLSANMTWDFIGRLRKITSMKIVIKGILTAEDARLCVENGVDGLVVSNHGGRGEDSGRATIDALPEIADAVQGRMLVLVDGGFRRGTDVCKALAMGADAVGIGRPYLWGLGAFGEPGVAKVLEILRKEFHSAMMQCGVQNVKGFTRAFVGRA